MEEYINQLNDQQRDAVLYDDGPSLVIAGAGSGKTRVLTYKIVHLIRKGYTPSRILALTFTNKAAREMKSRIATLLDENVAAKLWMGTFHSIFLKILRFNCEKIGFKNDFTIYDTTDSKSLVKMLLKDMGLDEKIYKPNDVLNAISIAKNCLISPKSYSENRDLRREDANRDMPQIYAIYNAYMSRCRASNAMDFDDILYYTNVLLRDYPDVCEKYQDYFEYILVDEYQDTNFAQHIIVSQLSKKRNKLCVVGDDAQSIYSFRGANIGNILSLEKRIKELKVFKLEQNYRSTRNIINAANSLIAKNRKQIEKHIFSNNEEGQKVAVKKVTSGYEEGYMIVSRIVQLKALQSSTYDDFAILYRTNAQSRLLEEAFRNKNIPYRIYGGLSFYQRKEVKDVISYFRLTVNPSDDEALKRIINNPPRGIGDTTVGKITGAAVRLQCSMWEVMTNYTDEINVNKGTLNKLNMFVSMMQKFIDLYNSNTPADALASKIITDSRLLAVLETENTPENVSRRENINEIMAGVQEFVNMRIEQGIDELTLSHYLSEISLATDQDGDDTGEGPRVTMMTIHAAKGLEFRNVFIVGVEKDLFPSKRCRTASELEEERRLMYVAITRAKEYCCISYADTRYINGQNMLCSPSLFIRDIDSQYLNFDTNRFKERDYDSPQVHYTPVSSIVTIKPRTNMVQNTGTATTNTNSDDFTTHFRSEISEGMIILHSMFGEGTITSIDDSRDTRIIVKFKNAGEKTILLKFAKFKIIK